MVISFLRKIKKRRKRRKGREEDKERQSKERKRNGKERGKEEEAPDHSEPFWNSQAGCCFLLFLLRWCDLVGQSVSKRDVRTTSASATLNYNKRNLNKCKRRAPLRLRCWWEWASSPLSKRGWLPALRTPGSGPEREGVMSKGATEVWKRRSLESLRF